MGRPTSYCGEIIGYHGWQDEGYGIGLWPQSQQMHRQDVSALGFVRRKLQALRLNGSVLELRFQLKLSMRSSQKTTSVFCTRLPRRLQALRLSFAPQSVNQHYPILGAATTTERRSPLPVVRASQLPPVDNPGWSSRFCQRRRLRPITTAALSASWRPGSDRPSPTTSPRQDRRTRAESGHRLRGRAGGDRRLCMALRRHMRREEPDRGL